MLLNGNGKLGTDSAVGQQWQNDNIMLETRHKDRSDFMPCLQQQQNGNAAFCRCHTTEFYFCVMTIAGNQSVSLMNRLYGIEIH